VFLLIVNSGWNLSRYWLTLSLGIALWLGFLNTAEPAAAPQTILVLGDSISAGNGIDPSQAFPAVLQDKIDRAGLPYKIVNAGVSGDTSAGGLRRINWLLRQPVSVLLLELGGNDGLRGLPLESTRTNLQKIIDRTREKYPTVKIIIAGMQMPPNLGADYVGEFRQLFPDLAKANHATLIPFLLEGVGGRRELNQADMIHPTVEGHAAVAETVWKILEPILKQSAAVPQKDSSEKTG